ncbi:MAG: N-acetyltransferase [Cellulophaga sp.]
MNNVPIIKLYGAENCHKTNYYKLLLASKNFNYSFLDVESNIDYAEELQSLYENRKLNFPTITIGTKKLRNPTKEDLNKWLNKLIISKIDLKHNKQEQQFTLDINGKIAKVEYKKKDNGLHLIHSEVPFNLRGQGIGKILVEKTFEKLTKEGYNAIAVCSYIKLVASRSSKWKNIIT